MNAVRSEVEELKEKIIRLEDTISNLQNENEVLKRNVPSDVLRQISNTSTPQLAVQQQPPPSTAYQNVAVNHTSQQSLPAATPIASGNVPFTNTAVTSTTSGPNINATIVGALAPQVSNPVNPLNVASAVAPGIVNINQPSQMPPAYISQATGTNVTPANKQASTPQPPH